MKLEKTALAAALKNWPPELQAALVFGREAALVRARALAIARQIVADLSDPFRVVDMPEAKVLESPALLADEVAAYAMLGGRRLVRLAGGDGLLEPLQNALTQPGVDAMILIEAGDLPAKSKLRSWAEAAKNVAAIICYPEDTVTLVTLLQDAAKAQKYRLTDDAARIIVAASGSVRDVALSELEKTMLYVGTARATIDDSDVLEITADAGSAGFEGMIAALCRDDGPALDQQLGRLFTNGESGIAVLRAVSRRLWLLGKAHADIGQGGDRDSFMTRAFGKSAWKEGPEFKKQLASWPPQRVARGLARLLEADRKAKLSGASGELVVAQALMGLLKARPR